MRRLFFLLLVALVPTVVAEVPEDDLEELGSVPFGGTILWAAQLDGAGLASDRPICETPVPAGAERARVHLEWVGRSDEPVRMRITAFDGDPTRVGAESLGSAEGGAPLVLWVEVTDVQVLWLKVEVTEGLVADQPFWGEKVFFAARGNAAPAVHAAVAAPASHDIADGRATAFGIALVGLAGLMSLWRRVPRLPFLAALFTRIAPRRVLEHPLRARLYDLVVAEPGVHLEALIRTLGSGRGNLEHHIRLLVGAGLVVEERVNGYRCLFAAGALPREARRDVGVVKAEGARRLLAAIAASPGLSVRGAASRAGLAPATASYHAKKLRAGGLVRAERDAGSGLTLTERGVALVREMQGAWRVGRGKVRGDRRP